MAEIQQGLHRLGWRVAHQSGGRVEYEHPKADRLSVLVLDFDRARVNGGVWAALNADKMRAIGFCDPRRDDRSKPRAETFPRVWVSLEAWPMFTASDLIRAHLGRGESDPAVLAEFLAGDWEAGRAASEQRELESERRLFTVRTGWRL